MPRSLRWRLTLAFTAVGAVIVLATAVYVRALVAQAVWSSLDAALQEEAGTLVTIRDGASGGDLARMVADVGAEHDLGPGKFIRVLDAGGRTLAASGAVPAAVATAGDVVAAAPPAGETIRAVTVGAGGDAYRVVSYTVAGRGVVRVGVGAVRQTAALRQADVTIGIAGAGLLILLFGLVWAITARATSELDRVAAELETIETGSLDRRLAARRITEVDRLARVLNRLLGRLEEAMAHLRRFTADAAHELRTPIAALRAHLEVALGRARSVEAYREGLLDALEQTERLGRLAEDLLTLSDVESGGAGRRLSTEPVRLDALVREVVDALAPVAEEQGRSFTAAADDAVRVAGAPALLKRVILNLVDNAFRHTPPDAAVHLSVGTDDGSAVLAVHDEGPGIPAVELPLVFERFHHGARAHGGAGLGLALCREIVTRHGGSITLTSAPGEGATATVRLPLLASAPLGVAARPAAPPTAPRRGT
jgi:two-component system, OmpR family, sensor kinase